MSTFHSCNLYPITDIACVLGTPSPDFNSTRIGLNTSGTIFPNPPSVLPSQANKLVPVPPPPPPSSHQQLHTLEHLVSDLRDQVFSPVLRIDDILVWFQIRIRGSMPLTNGSGFGSRSYYFRHWPSRGQQKTYFLKVLLFEGTFTSVFKDKKSKRSHKTVGIKVFLIILLD